MPSFLKLLLPSDWHEITHSLSLATQGATIDWNELTQEP